MVHFTFCPHHPLFKDKAPLSSPHHRASSAFPGSKGRELKFEATSSGQKYFRDNIKCFNIGIIGAPEGEEEEQEIGNIFEKIMKENFPNLPKELDVQVQEAQRVRKDLDPRRNTPRHIIIK